MLLVLLSQGVDESLVGFELFLELLRFFVHRFKFSLLCLGNGLCHFALGVEQILGRQLAQFK